MTDLQHYLAAFKEARKMRKYSLNDLAEAMQVSKQAVFNWERGTHRPTEEHLFHACDLLGLDYDLMRRWREL